MEGFQGCIAAIHDERQFDLLQTGRKLASGCFAVFLFVVVVVFFRAAPAAREDVLFLVDDDAELLRFRPVPADAKTNNLLK